MSAKAEAPSSDRELVLTRLIEAPREKLFRAWTEPELLKQWFASLPWTTPVAELDGRREPRRHARPGRQRREPTEGTGPGAALERPLHHASHGPPPPHRSRACPRSAQEAQVGQARLACG
jgi:Activator of Hsp90 ATPase homolog 1-like protein